MTTALHLQRCAAATLVIALTAASLPAQSTDQAPPPPVWRILRELEVEGAVFARDDIAGVLAMDPETLRALQRGLDDDAAELIADQIVTMHQLGGCPDATATATLTDGVVKVSVQAGPRYRCGEVLCAGNTRLTDAQIATRINRQQERGIDKPAYMATAEQDMALFQAGKFVVTSPHRLKLIRQRVAAAYTDIGCHGARAELTFERHDDTIDLLVQVIDEGRQVFLDSVQLDGEPDAEAATQVLAWAAPPPDTLATDAALNELRRRLEMTARYLEVKVEVPDRSPTRLAPLIVRVKQVDQPPAFDATVQRDALRIADALDQVAQQLQGRSRLELHADFDEARGSAPLVLLPGRISGAFGLSHVELEIQQLAVGNAQPATFAVHADPDLLRIDYGSLSSVLPAPPGHDLSVRLRLSTQLLANGEGELRWGIGTDTAELSDFEIDLHPSTALKMLQKADAVTHDGDDLVLRFGDTALRFAADGTIRDQPIGFVIDGVRYAVGLMNLPNPPEPRAAHDETGATARTDALRELFVDALGSALTHPTDRERIQAITRGLLDALVDALPFGAATEANMPRLPPERFAVPSLLQIAAGFLRQPCVRRSWSGNLLPACAFATAYLTDDRQRAGAALRELVRDEQVGPMMLAPISKLLHLTGNERRGEAVRELAKLRWSFDAVWHDTADLCGSFPALASVPVAAGAAFRRDPVLQQLFTDIPDGPDADAAAFRAGVRYWWSHGGETLLRRVLLGD